MQIRAVVIKGPFEEDEWQCVVDVIRSIERDHPNETYHIIALDPDKNSGADPLVENALQFLDRTFPRVEGREPELYYFPLSRGQ